MSAGNCSVGGVVSCTATENTELAELPAASCAEHVTCVEPTAKVLPEAGWQEMERAPSRLSVAAGAVNTTAAPADPVASAVTSACVATVGGVVSRTTTANVLLALFPAASCAEQLTIVLPIGNTEPEAG